MNNTLLKVKHHFSMTDYGIRQPKRLTEKTNVTGFPSMPVIGERSPTKAYQLLCFAYQLAFFGAEPSYVEFDLVVVTWTN